MQERSYVPPAEVTSPQHLIANVRPIVDCGAESWSAALFSWDGKPRLGLRWNGSQVEGRTSPHPGNPQSRGLPTWFVVPEELAPAVLSALSRLGYGGHTVVDAEQAARWAEEEIRRRGVADEGDAGGLADKVRAIVLAMKADGEI